MILGMRGNQQRRLELLRALRVQADCFQLVVESVSSIGFTYLDLTILKGPRWHRGGHLDFSLFSKRSSLWQPLSALSCHHPSVHDAWPLADLARRVLRCSSQEDRREAEKALISAFRHRFGYFPVSGIRKNTSRISAQPNRLFPRLIVPYNFVWGRAGVVSALHDVAQWQGLQHVRLSWSLNYPYLLVRLKKSNGSMSESSDCYDALFSMDGV